MTISPEVWTSILKTWPGHIWQDYEQIKNVDIMSIDLMGYLYKTPIETGDGYRLTCFQFMERLCAPFFKLFEITEVKTIVFCLDPLNNPRPEKAMTAKSRKASQKKKEDEDNAPKYLYPNTDGKYFDFSLRFPGPIDLIFKTPAAKERLFYFFEDYLLSEPTRKLIPKGRSIVLSGCVEPDPNVPSSSSSMEVGKYSYVNCAPCFISSYHDKDEIECRRMPEHFFETLSEADCDVVRWVFAFPEYHRFAVFSNDRDIFVIMLLAMTRILRVNCERKCFYVTKAVLADAPPTPEEKKAKMLLARQATKERKKQTYETLVSSGVSKEDAYVHVGGYGSKSLSKPVVIRNQKPSVDQIVDVPAIYLEMCREAYAVSKCKCANVGTCPKGHVISPVELYAAGICISTKSHDYLSNLMSGIGAMIIWVKFIENIYLLRNLVQVTVDADSETLRYAVHWGVLKKCVDICSHGKFGLKENKNFPTEEQIRAYAARLSWYLNYIGNGVNPLAIVQDGLEIDVRSGLSLYGYQRGSFADDVHKPKNPVYYAPLIKQRRSSRIKRRRQT
jgi:hypothetical protein